MGQDGRGGAGRAGGWAGDEPLGWSSFLTDPPKSSTSGPTRIDVCLIPRELTIPLGYRHQSTPDKDGREASSTQPDVHRVVKS